MVRKFSFLVQFYRFFSIGPHGSGKSAMAAKMAIESDFPFVRLITPRICHGSTEASTCNALVKAFEDAYKSPLSLILLDNIESIFGYSPVGLRYSSVIMQTLKDLIMSRPPNPESKVFVIATTTAFSFLESNDLDDAFSHKYFLPKISALEDFMSIIQLAQILTPSELEHVQKWLGAALEFSQPKFDISLKRFFDVLTDTQLATTEDDKLTVLSKSMAHFGLNFHTIL